MDQTLTDRSMRSCTPDSLPPPSPPPLQDIEMKDVSATSSRPSRHAVYPKKRPSPNGVSKSRGRPTPTYSSPSYVCSIATRADQIARKQRQAQIERLHKQGIYIEEEYREEIHAYMQETEVQSLNNHLRDKC
jgi:hypothetical protein